MPELPTVQVLPGKERAEQPVFYYDLGEPLCYLAAEAVMSTLPIVPEWEPVLASEVMAPSEPVDIAAIAAEVQELGLQTLRWPATWPPDTRAAMLAATYAKRIGRAVAFSLAAFRQAFAGGRDLADLDTILLAGAACEMHPTALRKGLEMRSVTVALEAATDRARRAGVTALPAIQVEDQVFAGAGALSEAEQALR